MGMSHPMPKSVVLQSSAINNFPALLPGETMLGYLARVVLVNQANLYSVSSHVLGLKSCLEPPWVVPCNLARLCDFAKGALGSANDLLQNHTVFPAVAPFLKAEIRARLSTQIIESNAGGIRRGVIRPSAWEGNAPARMAWCPKCVGEDEATYGFSYWRREHQLDICSHCVRHSCPLAVGCGLCTFPLSRRAAPALPTARCQCGRGLRTIAVGSYVRGDGSLLSKSHEFLRSLFDNPLPLDELDHIGATLQERAIELDLTTGVGIRQSAMMKLVEHVDGLHLLAPRWGSRENAIHVLTRPLRHGETSSNLAVNVLLVGVLFSSGDDFRTALTRNRVAGKLGTDCRERVSAPVHNASYAASEYHLKKRLQTDRQISTAIRQRHAAVLASSERPIRFTRGFFLADIPGGRSIVRKTDMYPLISATIQELAETREQYMCRRAAWLMKTDAE
ncbi:TniQ family protein [Burkholderia sp. S-53]|uniref:TniQ family protein n=1 Tax=Burkholderia sp. S-53 TaxID=2906514 RepID=UPI00399C37B0